MKTTINCFLPFSRLEETVQTVKELRASTLVDKFIYWHRHQSMSVFPDANSSL